MTISSDSFESLVNMVYNAAPTDVQPQIATNNGYENIFPINTEAARLLVKAIDFKRFYYNQSYRIYSTNSSPSGLPPKTRKLIRSGSEAALRTLQGVALSVKREILANQQFFENSPGAQVLKLKRQIAAVQYNSGIDTGYEEEIDEADVAVADETREREAKLAFCNAVLSNKCFVGLQDAVSIPPSWQKRPFCVKINDKTITNIQALAIAALGVACTAGLWAVRTYFNV